MKNMKKWIAALLSVIMVMGLLVGCSKDNNGTPVVPVATQGASASAAATTTAPATEPAPAVHFTGFGDSSLNLHIGAWCKTEDYHQARFAFGKAILTAFARENINIPFPIRTVIHNGN